MAPFQEDEKHYMRQEVYHCNNYLFPLLPPLLLLSVCIFNILRCSIKLLFPLLFALPSVMRKFFFLAFSLFVVDLPSDSFLSFLRAALDLCSWWSSLYCWSSFAFSSFVVFPLLRDESPLMCSSVNASSICR